MLVMSPCSLRYKGELGYNIIHTYMTCQSFIRYHSGLFVYRMLTTASILGLSPQIFLTQGFFFLNSYSGHKFHFPL